MFLTGLQVWHGGALNDRATLCLSLSSCMFLSSGPNCLGAWHGYVSSPMLNHVHMVWAYAMIDPSESVRTMSELFWRTLWSDQVIAFEHYSYCLGICYGRTKRKHLVHVQIVSAHIMEWPYRSFCPMSKLFGRMLWSDPVIAFAPCPRCLGVYDVLSTLVHVKDYTVRPYQFMRKTRSTFMIGHGQCV